MQLVDLSLGEVSDGQAVTNWGMGQYGVHVSIKN